MQKTEDFDSGVYASDAKQPKHPNQPLQKGMFNHPFSRDYWKCAAAEFRNPRMLVFAALIIAMRVLVKSLKIHIVPGLSFTFDFIVNSAGSMIYGPVVALLVGAVSDTLGAIFFPSPMGPYFLPFILVEMLSGFIFALFLYRQKLTTWRIVLSRIAVVVICNFIVNPLIMIPYYKFILGKAGDVLTVYRVIKGIAMLPVESIVLVIWLNAISRIMYKLDLVHFKPEKLKFTWKHAVAVALAVVIAAAGITGFVFYKKKRDEKKEQQKQNKTSFAICTELNLCDSGSETGFPFEKLIV